MNLRALLVAASTWLALVAIFLFASGALRGLVGDVVVIVFGVAALAAVRAGSPRVRAPGMLLLGCGLEAWWSPGAARRDRQDRRAIRRSMSP